MKFEKNFYLNDTLEIAENLLGSLLCTNINSKFASGRIVEVEAYLGVTDKAPDKKEINQIREASLR